MNGLLHGLDGRMGRWFSVGDWVGRLVAGWLFWLNSVVVLVVLAESVHGMVVVLATVFL